MIVHRFSSEVATYSIQTVWMNTIVNAMTYQLYIFQAHVDIMLACLFSFLYEVDILYGGKKQYNVASK